jgi:hypothetical protein
VQQELSQHAIAINSSIPRAVHTPGFSVTSSTTLVDFPGLTTTLEANRYYNFQALIMVNSGGSAGGYKATPYSTTTPGLGKWVGFGLDTAADAVAGYQQSTNWTGGSPVSLITTSTTPSALFFGQLLTSTGGVLKMQVAQNTSNATATAFSGVCYLIVQDAS